jgi:hypothetical protein
VSRSGAFALTGEARLGGVGSTDTKLARGDLGLGAQAYLGDGDVAAFIGGGVDLGYMMLVDTYAERTGSGFGAYTELGVEFMRTHRTGAFAALRADIPFYALEDNGPYVAALSLSVGLAVR